MLYQSWGIYPLVSSQKPFTLHWRSDRLPPFEGTVIPYGMGRSAGDVCLNDGQSLLLTRRLKRFIEFDQANGRLNCEAGMSLDEILRMVQPKGWTLATLPSSRRISLGGAIANDVHGLSQFHTGSFSHHIRSLELLRSDGEHLTLNARQNPDLLQATIGGLGLTGLILSATLQLEPFKAPGYLVEKVPFEGWSELINLFETSDPDFFLTRALLNPFSKEAQGIFVRANPCHTQGKKKKPWAPTLNLPQYLKTGPFMRKWHNTWLTYEKRRQQFSETATYLDGVCPDDLLPKNTFWGTTIHYQCLFPNRTMRDGALALVSRIASAAPSCYRAWAKQFGPIPSQGLLAFPKPGLTLAFEVSTEHPGLLTLLDELDEIVLANQGSLYLGKDSRMQPETFGTMYPMAEEFMEYVDPRFSSTFWRRMTG